MYTRELGEAGDLRLTLELGEAGDLRLTLELRRSPTTLDGDRVARGQRTCLPA
jgi:hypothetical protein